MTAAESDKANAGPCCCCGKLTEWACSDCAIEGGITVYVCPSPTCRDKHERTHKPPAHRLAAKVPR